MTYSGKDIEVLDDISHIRKRVGMYLGSADSDGIWHSFKELLDNSLDEYLAGHCNTIWLFLEPNLAEPYYCVRDNGRGIPVETHEKTGISTLTTVFTNLQAGGKFSKQAYAVSAGLNGVGLKATNSTAEWLSAVVWRKKQCWQQSFVRGEYTQAPVRYTDRDGEYASGTEVSFWPDSKIFRGALDTDRLVTHVEAMAHLCPGLTFHITLNGETRTIAIEGNGLLKLVSDAAAGETILHDPIVVDTKEVKGVLLWTSLTGEEERCQSFVNLSPTPEHGTHVSGLRRAVAKAVNDFAKEPQKADDLRVGLISSLSTFVQEPSFKGQTKSKLSNPETENAVYDAVYPVLFTYFDKHKSVAAKIVERAKGAQKAREAYKKLKSALGGIQVAKNARGVLPTKLVEAPDCPVEKRELFIVEGNSAAGTAVAARDTRYQEILPLKGKPVNALVRSVGETLGNDEVQSLISAIGLQLDPKSKTCDLSKRRVGRVLLLCDADPDGQHISALVMAFFCVYAKELIDAGCVYLVESPLFRAKDVKGTHTWFGNSMQELESVSKMARDKLLISRLKGHGEATAEELRHYATDPKTRQLTHMTQNPEQLAKFCRILGDDADDRKALLNVQQNP